MSIAIHWDNSERNILRLTFDGVWTPAQVDRAFALALDKVRAARQPLFLLVNVQPRLSDWTASACCSPIDRWPANLTGVIFVHEQPTCQVITETLRGLRQSAGYVPPMLCVDSLTSAYETLTVWHLQAELTRQSSAS